MKPSEILRLDSACSEYDAMRTLTAEERYREAVIAALALLQREPCFAPALVLFALAAMLEDPVSPDVELDDVRYALEKAARLATDADDAPYEYADHVFSISGNTALALELVNSYLARFSERMRELLLLKADCLSDLDKEGPADEVLRLVEDFSKLLAHAGDIR